MTLGAGTYHKERTLQNIILLVYMRPLLRNMGIMVAFVVEAKCLCN